MKVIATVLAATMALGTIMTSAAEARPRGAGYAHGHARAYGYRRHRGNAGAAAALGIAGALIGGAAIAASQRHRGYDYYDAPGYGPGPGYYDGY
jgi:hypothetical protein